MLQSLHRLNRQFLHCVIRSRCVFRVVGLALIFLKLNGSLFAQGCTAPLLHSHCRWMHWNFSNWIFVDFLLEFGH